MKVQVLQENLSKTLHTTSRFTSARVQLPVLANVLLSSNKNKFTISATNLETSVCLSIGAKVEKEGDITIPSRTITDLVVNLNPGHLSLEAEKELLKITASGFNSTLRGMNASDFPQIPNSLDKDVVNVEKDSLLKALGKTLFAVSVDETRPVLTGVLLILNEGELVLVATDGFRLSQVKIKFAKKQKTKEKRLILPKNTLSELIRIVENEMIDFSLDLANKRVLFAVSNGVLTSRVIEGDFPDFEKIIPKESKFSVFLDKDDLLQAVKLASVFAKESANVVKLNLSENELEVSSEGSQSGSQSTKVDVKTEGGGGGEGLVIAYNYRFLEDFLNSCEGEDVEMRFSDQNSPGLFLDTKDPSYQHIIMPVKLQS